MDNKKEKTIIPNPKIDIPFDQAADIATAGVQKSDSVLHKSIYWEDNVWHCEELILKVFENKPGKDQVHYELDPNKATIEITDSENWLEIKAIKQADDGKSLVVEIKLREAVEGEIRPPGSLTIEEKSVNVVFEENRSSVSEPVKRLETTANINLLFDLDIVPISAATEAAGGMFGMGEAIQRGLGLGKQMIKLTYANVIYVVEPPIIKWELDRNHVFNLDGKTIEQYGFILDPNCPQAASWVDSATINLFIPEKVINDFAVSIENAVYSYQPWSDPNGKKVIGTILILLKSNKVTIKPVKYNWGKKTPDESLNSSQTFLTSSESSPMPQTDIDNESKPNNANENIPVTLNIYSDYLGSQYQDFSIPVSVLEVNFKLTMQLL